MTRRATLVLVVVLSSAWVSSPAGAGDRFMLPEDDLPSAVVAGHTVAFTRNGAFAVAKDGRWLFDGGLTYAMPGWQEWGTQIRRSDHKDTWRFDDSAAQGQLSIHGTLFDDKRVERFKFVQDVMLIPGGLRFSYEVTPLEARRVREFGLTFHFPMAETTDAEIEFWPGFRRTALPQRYGRAQFFNASARAVALYVSGGPRVVAVASGEMKWNWLDERAWQLDRFRFVGWDEGLTVCLSRGETIVFSFEVLLGAPAWQTFPLGPSVGEMDRYGRIAVRAAGRKVVEGGLGLGGGPPVWMFWHSRPAVAPQAEAEDGVLPTSGMCLIGGREMAYEVQVTRQLGHATVTYRVRRADDESLPPGIRLIFAAPVPEVMSVSAHTEAASGKQDTVAGTDEEGGFQHVVVLVHRSKIILELRADAPWAVDKCKIDGTQCHVFSVPTSSPDAGTQEATVQIEVSVPQEAVEEVP